MTDLRSLWLKMRAFAFFLHHREAVYLTVVRRYVDAQNNYIGELYLGEGAKAKMIGMSCDNLPFSLKEMPNNAKGSLEFKLDFLAPLPPNTIRVGALEPKDNAKVRFEVGVRQYCPIGITVLNRFIEHVMEPQRG